MREYGNMQNGHEREKKVPTAYHYLIKMQL